MTRWNETSSCDRSGAAPTQAHANAHARRTTACAALLAFLAVTACAHEQETSEHVTATTDAAPSSVLDESTRWQGHAPTPADSIVSHCAADESVLISCRIAGTEDVASICVSPGELGEKTRVYYAFGQRTQTVSVYPDDRSAHAGRFRKAVFQRPGGTGSGYAYTFEKGADKYVFYSVNSEDNSDFGVLRLSSGGSVSSRMVCDQDSAVEFQSDALHRFTQTWDRDPEIDGRGLPSLEQ